jgi:hypothetical protein
MKQLQISLIEQFYERKGEMDWNRWSRDIELRRDEINAQLKKGIKTGGIKGEDIDVLIDKSWDELFSIIGVRRETSLEEEKLEAIFHRILAALPASSPVPSQVASAIPPKADSGVTEQAEEAEPAEEIESFEDIESFQEVVLPEEPEEVEELAEEQPAEHEEEPEELSEVEELEELDEEPSVPSGDDLQQLASKIEFSASVSETEGEEPIKEDLEIVSPFSTMLSNFSFSGEDEERLSGENEETSAEADISAGEPGDSSIGRRYFSATGKEKIDELETVPDGNEKTGPEQKAEAIEEREGVHYVNDDAMKPDNENHMDRDFKDLVDSIIK